MKKKGILFLLMVLCGFYTFAQKFETHKVKRGENIVSIAKKYKVSEKSILKYNPDARKGNLTGTVLVIPVEKSDDDRNLETTSVLKFKEYKVKRKETLYSIAKEYHISVEDLKQYNEYLYKKELGKGDVIRIPIFTKKDTININNSVQNSTFENLKHVVMPKEGKFGIAKKYGMTIEQLNALNPGMETLQPGQVLNVINPQNRDTKAANDTNNPENFISYTIKPKENYYRLTKRFNTSKDSLLKYNPALAEEGLNAGMTIRIPKPDGMMSDTLAAGSSKKIQLERYIKDRSRKNIAIMLPFSLRQFKVDSIDKEELLKEDKILRVSLDFYSGVMYAIDSVQKKGIAVNAKIYDTEKSSAKLNKILQGNDFSDVQAVIGPLLTKNVEKASQFFSSKNIPVLSPLIDADLKGADNLLQTRPSKIIMEKALITYIDSLKEGKNLIILADKEHAYLKSKLAYTFPNAKVVQQKKDYMQASDLTAVISKEQENWVILESDDLELISNATSYLNAMAPNYQIRVFTSDKSEPYENEISNAYLSNLNFTYASVSKECENFKDNSFVKGYIEDYGILPNKYATRGFDVTYDLLLRLAVGGDDIYEAIEMEGVAEYVENEFSYHKKMIGGYYNDAVYIIQYEEGLKLKVVN